MYKILYYLKIRYMIIIDYISYIFFYNSNKFNFNYNILKK